MREHASLWGLVANAHILGATPWQRPDYLRKFSTLTEGVLDAAEAARFLQVAESLPRLRGHELAELTIALPAGALGSGGVAGIFGFKRG
jgi:2-methylcitrate dehydratase